jgi:Coproporphyrinogen III oxidase and related Fe-S oxidoreductases
VDYLSFGTGASSLFNNVRYSNIKDLEVYAKNSSEVAKIRCDVEFLDEKSGMEEFIFLGLRMIDGINDTEFKDEFGVSLRAVYGDEIDKLVEQGLLDFDEHDLKLTRKGISVSNHVFVELLA